jgi:hypothetical protein
METEGETQYLIILAIICMKKVHKILTEIIKTLTNKEPNVAQHFLEIAQILQYHKTFYFDKKDTLKHKKIIYICIYKK